jgi:hypothetical protein
MEFYFSVISIGLAPNVAEEKYWIEYKAVAKKT